MDFDLKVFPLVRLTPDLIIDIIECLDCDIADFLRPETSEEPEEAIETLMAICRMVSRLPGYIKES